MASYPSTVASTTRGSALTTNKVLRNTYLLLAATLGFSALMAGIAMTLNIAPLNPWITLIVYFGLLFGVSKTENSSMGLLFIFLLTGFLGFTLGPIVNLYLKFLPNGAQVVTMALGRHRRELRGSVGLCDQEREGLQLHGRLPDDRRHRRLRAGHRRADLQALDAVAGGLGHVRGRLGRLDAVADERNHPRR